jgi:hypothetical protein
MEQVIGPGYQLFHTRRIGWMLRQLELWPDAHAPGGSRWVFVDVDDAPDGQLGALLIRHQERQWTARTDKRTPQVVAPAGLAEGEGTADPMGGAA